MIWLASLSLVCAGVPAVLFLVNLRAYRPPSPAASSSKEIAVLIPARDEAEKIEMAVRAALGSDAAAVIVLDDGSGDETAEIVRQISLQDNRLRLLTGKPLSPGWCGKNFACAQLAAAATTPVLVFVDADVQLAPGSAPRLAVFLEESGAQLASGVPREVVITFSEQLLIPLIHFLLLGFLPLHRMRRTRHPAYGAGCGQLFVADAAAYRTVGGHGAIRDRIHEGLWLPKKFREHGLATDLFDATALATCRMYERNGEVWRGLAKNTHEGLGAPTVILPMTFLLLCGQVLPFLLLFAPVAPIVRAMAAAACGLVFLPRLFAASRFQQPWVSALLHPFAIVALLGIQWFGFVRFLLGWPAVWKGRAYPAPPPPSSCIVRQASPSAAETLRLVQQLWDELVGIYPELNAPSAPPPEVARERAGFVIAWIDGEAVGCGAFSPLSAEESEVAEIRRMYVEPRSRRRGVSRSILAELEREARECGYAIVRLETGIRQPNAIRLYENSGYRRIEPYGRYRGDALSVCFEKRL